MPKVLISDKLSPAAISIFKERNIEVDMKTGLDAAQLSDIIGEYDGLAIRSATKVTDAILAKAPKLKVVGRAGIGVDNVDIKAATARGVVVMNTPFGNSVTTAEHAISLMLALARDITAANNSTHAGKWEKNRFMGVEITGKTLGLIGCGNIGGIVADRAQGLKMKVIAYDPFLSPEKARDINVEKVELDELFKRADFITLHTPLNESTRGIINAESIAKMKKGVRIINCARGGLIDEGALEHAIASGQVAGAALDVLEVEPAKEHPLFGNEKVILTPHLGASTNEAQENVALQVAEQMSDFLNTGAITNAVNMPSVSAEDAAKLKPYLALAEQLGSFAGQLAKMSFSKVSIEFEGLVTALNVKPLTAVLMKGLMQHQDENVNMVNASAIARDRNIEISEIKHERAGNYQTLIKIKLSGNANITVAGTLSGGSAPRIVSVGDMTLEAALGGIMLYVRNEDKPGLIGALGRLLGDNNINIANFHLGRNKEHTSAVALLEVDDKISDDLLKSISALPSVKEAVLLNF